MISTLINLLTVSRIFISMIIFVMLMLNDYYMSVLALFIFAGLTDYLDGFLARKYNVSSQIGEILDPIADKILVIFLFFGLALNLSSYLIGFFGSFIISREIWVSALRDYNSRNNNSNATKVIYISKIKTTIQIFTIFLYLFAMAFNFMLMMLIADIFLIMTALITVYTGYIYTKNTFNI